MTTDCALPHCVRCGQPRTTEQLFRGICGACRAHACTVHNRGTPACYSECGCRCRPCARAWYKAEQSRRYYRAKGQPARLDATGTQRRIRALWALGHPSEAIARAAGLPSDRGVWQIAGNRSWVSRDTAARINRAYSLMSMRPGTSSVTAARARAKGYAPPLAWDDGAGPHGIDNPDATPYINAETARHGADVAEEVRHLIGTDSPDGIAKRLGITRNGLHSALQRSGNRELSEQLAAETARNFAAMRPDLRGKPQQKRSVA